MKGILTSQIGYDADAPVRIVARGPAGWVADPQAGRLEGAKNPPSRAEAFAGEVWGSSWWIWEWDSLPSGRYVFLIETADGLRRSDAFFVEQGLLWQETWRWCGHDQAERRAKLAMNGIGWQDCGAPWQEANSHAAYMLGLLDLLELRRSDIPTEDQDRIEAQVVNGGQYLARLQDRALELGHPAGLLCHQMPRYEEHALPSDAEKAAIAWARAARICPSAPSDWMERAARALRGAIAAPALPSNGWRPTVHGGPGSARPESPETRALLARAWAAWELGWIDECASLVDEALLRQSHEPMAGLDGWLAEHPGAWPECAWTHHVDEGVVGPDLGGHLPHFVLPVVRLIQNGHPQSEQYREALRRMVQGWLLPASGRCPFDLLPQGLTPEGPYWFAGLWHGINAAYLMAAALAWEIHQVVDEPRLIPWAHQQMQWVAGLNAGLTEDALSASVFCHRDVRPGEALPVSMINGIGGRSFGSWLNVRGAICNGFATGGQFVFDTQPNPRTDHSLTFTDEDWITHAGAWLSAIARLSHPTPENAL